MPQAARGAARVGAAVVDAAVGPEPIPKCDGVLGVAGLRAEAMPMRSAMGESATATRARAPRLERVEARQEVRKRRPAQAHQGGSPSSRPSAAGDAVPAPVDARHHVDRVLVEKARQDRESARAGARAPARAPSVRATRGIVGGIGDVREQREARQRDADEDRHDPESRRSACLSMERVGSTAAGSSRRSSARASAVRTTPPPSRRARSR